MNADRATAALTLGGTLAGLILVQALLGGVRLVYALPAGLVLGLAGAASAWRWRRTPGFAASRWCLAATLLLAGYLIGRALLSPVEMLARPDLFTAAGALLVYLLTALFLTRPRERFPIFAGLMIFASLHVAVGLWQFKDQANFMPLPWVVRPDYGFKASGFFVSPGHLATLLGMLGLMSLSLSCWARVEITWRAVAFYGFIVCLTGTAFTGSRSGYYSVVAGLTVFTLLSIFLVRGFNRPHFFGVAIATAVGLTAIVALALYVVVNSPLYEKRLRHVREPGGKAVMLLHTVLPQQRISPIVGTGAGTYLYYGRQFRHPSVQADPQHAHNDPLEFWAEYGWVGGGLGGLFLLTHLGHAIRCIRRFLAQRLGFGASIANSEFGLLLGALGALVVLLVNSLGDFPFHIPALALLGAFFFAILAHPTEELEARARGPLLPRFVGLLPAGVAVALLAGSAWRWPGEFWTERARLALRDRDPLAAYARASRARAFDPANADAHYLAGEALHYRALAATDPAEIRALREEAAAAFQAGLQRFPQDVRLLLKLGRTLDDLGQTEPAGECFRRAIDAAPGSALVQAQVGLHLHRHGELQRASEFYRTAQALGETQVSTAGLADLERDQQFVRTRDAFSELLPDSSRDLRPAVSEISLKPAPASAEVIGR